MLNESWFGAPEAFRGEKKVCGLKREVTVNLVSHCIRIELVGVILGLSEKNLLYHQND